MNTAAAIIIMPSNIPITTIIIFTGFFITIDFEYLQIYP